MKREIQFALIVLIGLFSSCETEKIGGDLITEPENETEKQAEIPDRKEEDKDAELLVASYRFDSDENSDLMFQPGEPMEVITNGKLRGFNIRKVLQVRPEDATSIRIANFLPADLEDATILATISGHDSPIVLFKVEKIRGHAVKTFTYPFIKGEGDFLYEDIDGNAVDLSMYAETGIAPENITFDFTGNNEMIKKLLLLKRLKFNFKMHDYDKNNTAPNWKNDINDKDARRFTGYIINMAYLFARDEMRESFMSEPITENNGELMSQERKANVYQKILDQGQYKCGIVTQVSGLGGGSIFGLASYILQGYLNTGPEGTGAHETGHKIGFKHSSSMTYPKKEGAGFVRAVKWVSRKFARENVYPVTKYNYYFKDDLSHLNIDTEISAKSIDEFGEAVEIDCEEFEGYESGL